MAYLKIADPDKPGDYLVLHTRDFDPAVHTLFDAAPAPTPPALPADAGAPLTAAELVTAIKAMDASALKALQVTETTREGGPRKTVINAMTARFEQLNAA